MYPKIELVDLIMNTLYLLTPHFSLLGSIQLIFLKFIAETEVRTHLFT